MKSPGGQGSLPLSSLTFPKYAGSALQQSGCSANASESIISVLLIGEQGSQRQRDLSEVSKLVSNRLNLKSPVLDNYIVLRFTRGSWLIYKSKVD